MTIEWSTLSSLATSHVVVRGFIFNDCAQLVAVNLQWLATEFLIFKALISFAKLFESPLHYTLISSSWAKCVVDVVSYLHCLMTHFELE